MIKLEGRGVKRILEPRLDNIKEWLDWIFAEIPGRKAIERMLGPSVIFGILVVVDVGRGDGVTRLSSDKYQIDNSSKWC